MKVSFDFDGTLDDEFDRTINRQKEEIQSICKRYTMMLHDVYIITKRWGPNHRNEGLRNECDVVYLMADELGVKRENVYFTDRIYKDEIIKKLGIELHFENSEYEVKMIEKLGIKVVPVEDPYWRDLVY